MMIGSTLRLSSMISDIFSFQVGRVVACVGFRVAALGFESVFPSVLFYTSVSLPIGPCSISDYLFFVRLFRISVVIWIFKPLYLSLYCASNVFCYTASGNRDGNSPSCPGLSC